MANDAFPQGLKPLNTGGTGTVRVRAYVANTAADTYLGMPVKILAIGYVSPANAAAEDLYLGSMAGYLDQNAAGLTGAGVLPDPFLDVSDWTTVGNPYLLVTDDPDQEYAIE